MNVSQFCSSIKVVSLPIKTSLLLSIQLGGLINFFIGKLLMLKVILSENYP